MTELTEQTHQDISITQNTTYGDRKHYRTGWCAP